MNNIVQYHTISYNIVQYPCSICKQDWCNPEEFILNLKCVSLGNKHGKSSPCVQRDCKTCALMYGIDEVANVKQKKFKTGLGNCKTQNCIYCAACKICDKNYVGKSTQSKHKWINGHRNVMKKTWKTFLNANSDLSE